MSDFTFDPITHTYARDGVTVPSVTQILANCGISDVSGVPADKLAFAAERGTAVHKFCQYFDEDDADWAQVEGTILEPYCRAYAEFKKDTGFSPILVEHSFCNDLYAGTIDRVGELGGEMCVLDIKTGSKAQKSWRMQLAAYMDRDENIGMKVHGRVALHLKPNGTYKVIEYRDSLDFWIWECALALETWKRDPMGKARRLLAETI